MKENLLVRKIARKSLPLLRKYDVVEAGIFGSMARGDVHRKSDVDFLIKFKGRKSLLDLVGLKLDLEKSLRKKVDIVTYKSIHPLLKKSILEDEVKIL
ncbi:MAG: nucleotidyltransferase family protein [Nanoarchaeota archaeon]|nr:nucleotidyltransferase family protein [Nanoarchaeota archaeon]